MVALFCLVAWLPRLSILVRLISDSILVGFKAGAGLTIAMTAAKPGRRSWRRTQLL
jgi:MFS superfamily sulfate permease-like transporter